MLLATLGLLLLLAIHTEPIDLVIRIAPDQARAASTAHGHLGSEPGDRRVIVEAQGCVQDGEQALFFISVRAARPRSAPTGQMSRRFAGCRCRRPLTGL